MLEKDARILSETQLDVAFNQWDLVQKEIVCLNRLIEKLFNESEAIENIVNNRTVDNTYNWGWSNGYSTIENSPPRFDVERPYVPADRAFHYPINDKTFPEDIHCHFGRLHDVSNNCDVEEIHLESLGNLDSFLPIIGTISPISQSSSVVDEEIVMQEPKTKTCANKESSLTYFAVRQSSLPQTPVKFTTTLQHISYEFPIDSFELGQCSQNHELSSSDDSTTR